MAKTKAEGTPTAKDKEATRTAQLLELANLLELQLIQQSRDDFYKFCRYMDGGFFNDDKPHLKTIADALQKVADGEINALAVSMPPRAGKSYITSLFCGWLLGRETRKGKQPSIMRNSYAATLAEKFSRDIRDGIVSTPKFGRVFPEVAVSKKHASVDGWSLNKNTQPAYFCAGVGGSITGLGCRTVAILDDPIKNIEEALSETTIANVWNWYTSTHRSRLESGCPEIHIATRWSRKDPIGRLTDPYSEFYNPEMVVIKIPALDERGNSFCEAVRTTEEYHEQRRITDSFIWESEFMQSPIESKGLLYPVEELKRFTLDELKGKQPDGVLGFTDTADKGTDFLCSLIGSKYGKYTYVTDVLMTQDGVEITEPLVAQMLIDTQCNLMKIEANNGGESFARNTRALVANDPVGQYCQVIAEQQTTNKETRMLMASGYAKEYIYFRSDYKPGSEYDKFIRALTSYVKLGKNIHDDAPDALTGLANFTKLYGFEKPTAAKPEFSKDYFTTWETVKDEPTEDYINMKVRGA